MDSKRKRRTENINQSSFKKRKVEVSTKVSNKQCRQLENQNKLSHKPKSDVPNLAVRQELKNESIINH